MLSKKNEMTVSSNILIYLLFKRKKNGTDLQEFFCESNVLINNSTTWKRIIFAK